MPLLRSIHDDITRANVLARVRAPEPDSPARWGRMNAHQMICHLSDMIRFALGERDGPLVGSWIHHSVIKWFALGVPLRWPHGFPTARQFDQERDGTPPAEFEADRDDLADLMRRFSEPGVNLHAHPLFGPLSRPEWGRWCFRHADHHLRQFGV